MPSQFTVERVVGLKSSNHRAIAVLRSSSDGDIDAADTLENLSNKRRREVFERFDYWIDGGIRNNWFHGWSSGDYRNCFVFKWKENKACHRLYGFLFHPQPSGNPSFQICVLASHANKKEWETDPRELNGILRFLADPRVRGAIKTAFPDSKKGE